MCIRDSVGSEMCIRDSYELCFTAKPEHAFDIEQAMAECGVSVSVIGHIRAENGLRCLTSEGELFELQPVGYQHFESVSHVH
jgi:thiamine monophosphate kinase